MASKPITILTGINGEMTVDTPGAPSVEMYHSYYPNFLECPCCCVSNGADTVSITSREAIVRRDAGICSMPISMGAGYEVFSFPLRAVQIWALKSRNKCFCGWRHSMAMITSHGAGIAARLKTGTETEKFQADLRKMVANSRGLDLDTTYKQFEGGDCGGLPCISSNLRVGPAGDVTFTTTTASLCAINQEVQGGFLQDLRYIRYQEAGLCSQVCCGQDNAIEVALKSSFGEDNVLYMPMRKSWLPQVHAALMQAFRGSAAPDATVIKTFEAGKSKATVYPGLLSLATKPKCGSCDPTVTTTMQAQDVSYLYASLVPWQSYLMRALRALKFKACCKNFCAMITVDFCCHMLCDLNPFPFWKHFFGLIYLILSSIFNFLYGMATCCFIVCIRRTEVEIGGAVEPGLFRYRPTENPEKTLKEMAAALEVSARTKLGRGDNIHINAGPGTSTTVIAVSPFAAATGAGKTPAPMPTPMPVPVADASSPRDAQAPGSAGSPAASPQEPGAIAVTVAPEAPAAPEELPGAGPSGAAAASTESQPPFAKTQEAMGLAPAPADVAIAVSTGAPADAAASPEAPGADPAQGLQTPTASAPPSEA